MQVDDQVKEQATPFDPEFLDRLRSQAKHPASRKSSEDADLRSPYRQMEAPKDAVWPRAGIRPLRLIRGHLWWAARVWVDQGIGAVVTHADGLPVPTGLWVSANFATLPEAMDWAAAEVEKRRPKDLGSGPWGAAC